MKEVTWLMLCLAYGNEYLSFCVFSSILIYMTWLQTDALVRLLPLIGSSSIRYMDNRLFAILYGLIVNLLTGKEAYLYGVCSCYLCSTACLIGITGVLAPVLEENVFRGFFTVSLTKWYYSFSDFRK